MSEPYLLFRAAGIDWLLAMEHVAEVALCDADTRAGQQAGTHRAWRGRALPARDLCRYFAAAPAQAATPAHQLVVHGRQGPELLAVEEILGLVRIEPSSLVPFAPTTARTARHTDLALRRHDGSCALRLRWPLADDGDADSAA